MGINLKFVKLRPNMSFGCLPSHVNESRFHRLFIFLWVRYCALTYRACFRRRLTNDGVHVCVAIMSTSGGCDSGQFARGHSC